jgi:hypothetical protein
MGMGPSQRFIIEVDHGPSSSVVCAFRGVFFPRFIWMIRNRSTGSSSANEAFSRLFFCCACPERGFSWSITRASITAGADQRDHRG